MTLIEKHIKSFTDFVHKDVTETALFSPKEKELYEVRLKTYRDFKNVIKTAYDEGRLQAKMKTKTQCIVNFLKRGKLSVEEIAEDFDESIEFVLRIKKENNL